MFEDTVNEHRTNSVVHLNTFMDRTLIEHWASHIGLAVDQYISPSKPILNGHSFGQAVCVLRKRA